MPFLPKIYLIDNGSLRADATWALRDLAKSLSNRTGYDIQPVSLLHSNKVPAEELEGVPAKTFKTTLRRDLDAGHRSFICLPLFLGPSRAIVDYMPQLIEDARLSHPDMYVTIADPLCGGDVESPDPRLAKMLVRQVRRCIERNRFQTPKVAVTDHGTPCRPVNVLRNRVAEQVRALLGTSVASVLAASMERRDGEAYAFNEPLLENLARYGFEGGSLVVSMFFLLPGRHAGAHGDVNQICDELVNAGTFTQIERTGLLGSDPQLLEILADRLNRAIQVYRLNLT